MISRQNTAARLIRVRLAMAKTVGNRHALFGMLLLLLSVISNFGLPVMFVSANAADGYRPQSSLFASPGKYLRGSRYRTRSRTLAGPHVCGSSCCRGWRQGRAALCITPMCVPPCGNGGHCVRPSVCLCPSPYTPPSSAGKKPKTYSVMARNSNILNANPSADSRVSRIRSRVVCSPFTCFNGGTCLDGSCLCPDGYEGKKCEKVVVIEMISDVLLDTEASSPDAAFVICKRLCFHGTCDFGPKPACRCLPGYYGVSCQWPVRDRHAKSRRMTKNRPIPGLRYTDSRLRMPDTRFSAKALSRNASPSLKYGKCYKSFRGKLCGLSFNQVLTMKSCCTDGLGDAWGSSCTPCSRYPVRFKGQPRTDGRFSTQCPMGFSNAYGVCRDINECQRKRNACVNGMCVNSRGSYWCKCNRGYHQHASRKKCLRDGTSLTHTHTQYYNVCYLSVNSRGACDRSKPIAYGRKNACCCSIGFAWGRFCEICPKRGTAERDDLCIGQSDFIVTGPNASGSSRIITNSELRRLGATNNIEDETWTLPSTYAPVSPKVTEEKVGILSRATIAMKSFAIPAASMDKLSNFTESNVAVKTSPLAYLNNTLRVSLTPSTETPNRREHDANASESLLGEFLRAKVTTAPSTSIENSTWHRTSKESSRTIPEHVGVPRSSNPIPTKTSIKRPSIIDEITTEPTAISAASGLSGYYKLTEVPLVSEKTSAITNTDTLESSDAVGTSNGRSPLSSNGGRDQQTASSYLLNSGQAAGSVTFKQATKQPILDPLKVTKETSSLQSSDIDGCIKDVCGEGGTCVNTAGGYTCDCLEGYQLTDKSYCHDIDECIKDVCGEGGTCVNIAGAYTCDCLEGYQLTDKSYCEDIDECIKDVCGEGGTCVNIAGAYACDCLDGYQLTDKSYCEEIEEGESSVTFMWIPGHNNIYGNERANKLAKEAASASVTGPTRLTVKEARSIVTKSCQQEWVKRYEETATGSHYKRFFPSPNFSGQAKILPKLYSRIIFRLQTGHCRLNGHLHKIGCLGNGECSFCKVEETVDHFLLSCRKYTEERTKLLEEVRELRLPVDTKTLLTEPHLTTSVVEFVLSTGRDI